MTRRQMFTCKPSFYFWHLLHNLDRQSSDVRGTTAGERLRTKIIVPGEEICIIVVARRQFMAIINLSCCLRESWTFSVSCVFLFSRCRVSGTAQF